MIKRASLNEAIIRQIMGLLYRRERAEKKICVKVGQNARELRGVGSIDLQRAQTQKKIQRPGKSAYYTWICRFEHRIPLCADGLMTIPNVENNCANAMNTCCRGRFTSHQQAL